MNRRQFLAAVGAGAGVLISRAQDLAGDVPDWGGPVLDIHLHGKGPGGEWAHMQGCGVSHAQLLTSPMAEGHVKEEQAKHPGRFKYSVGVDPARADALDVLRSAVTGGASGFGEMKSRSKADGAEMKRVYELAALLRVPVTIHFSEGGTPYNEEIGRA